MSDDLWRFACGDGFNWGDKKQEGWWYICNLSVLQHYMKTVSYFHFPFSECWGFNVKVVLWRRRGTSFSHLRFFSQPQYSLKIPPIFHQNIPSSISHQYIQPQIFVSTRIFSQNYLVVPLYFPEFLKLSLFAGHHALPQLWARTKDWKSPLKVKVEKIPTQRLSPTFAFVIFCGWPRPGNSHTHARFDPRNSRCMKASLLFQM